MILLAGPWGFFVAVHVFNLAGAGPIGLDRAGVGALVNFAFAK